LNLLALEKLFTGNRYSWQVSVNTPEMGARGAVEFTAVKGRVGLSGDYGFRV